MKELGRVTFSPDTTCGCGSPQVSLRGLPKRERNNYLILIRRQEGREVRKIKHVYLYKINVHVDVVFYLQRPFHPAEVFQISKHTRSLWLKGAERMRERERERER